MRAAENEKKPSQDAGNESCSSSRPKVRARRDRRLCGPGSVWRWLRRPGRHRHQGQARASSRELRAGVFRGVSGRCSTGRSARSGRAETCTRARRAGPRAGACATRGRGCCPRASNVVAPRNPDGSARPTRWLAPGLSGAACVAWVWWWARAGLDRFAPRAFRAFVRRPGREGACDDSGARNAAFAGHGRKRPLRRRGHGRARSTNCTAIRRGQHPDMTRTRRGPRARAPGEHPARGTPEPDLPPPRRTPDAALRSLLARPVPAPAGRDPAGVCSSERAPRNTSL